MNEGTGPTPVRDALAVADPSADEVLARYPTTTDDRASLFEQVESPSRPDLSAAPVNRSWGIRVRRLVGLASLVLGGIALAGCTSSSGPVAEVEIRLAGDPEAGQTFTASGAAVDEGLICDTGAAEWVSGEVVAGEPLGHDEFAAAYDALIAGAEASGGVAEAVTLRSLSCADEKFGGTFTLQENLSAGSFAEVDPDADTLPFGTWEISQGTDSFAQLDGGGDHVVDFATSESVYSGEIGTG